MKIKQKKILVTGGAGFIGSHLCEKLLLEGNMVTCLDNYITGSEANIQYLMGNPDFEFINRDVIQPFYIDVDEIYNLACPASPVHYQSNPIRTIKTSIIGAINMLELTELTNAKILQASTSEVYGDPLVHPQHESYCGNVNPIGVRACYDESKRCAETLFSDYNRHSTLKIKIIRIFNTYGPKMSIQDGRVVSNFIVQALKGEDITIFGKGTQTRSFQYIDDLINAMIKMMRTEDSFIGPVNIGNPEEITILDLANEILKLTGSKSKLVFRGIPNDDPRKRQPDTTLAKEKLNWEPRIRLQEGLIKTIEYFSNQL
ncbi:SDR family oxidoreductase [Dysgonomonas capnocytophagoides]|uniref:UDP-glucuronate decarboxylase n=1 Tax=Dysgonomonas capnocytophagoides TaxID=45254 RepID=A0A4Y8LA00_9BACT|nr:UDP-glucuronic acid decarboxylase family protein [Dysgonomonas capnocytophagoides]TFD97850.1 SDR family oxidoreductase [Dysgonomonas capnocytophagoides]